MIPEASNFPNSFDDDTNLFVVHDSLRVRLLEDYNVGDTSILIDGPEEIVNNFPPNGIITLTEQCSDIDRRAISFYYNSRTQYSFDELELLPEFENLNISKPKKVTNVTMNVIDKHHNHLKDALIAAQSFLGTKNSTSESNLTGRIKKLKNLVYAPKAWFSVGSKIGLRPLTVEFKSESLRTDLRFSHTWDFGEEGESPLVISYENYEDFQSRNEIINGVEVFGSKIKKVYQIPGVYTVSLKVSNEYGDSFVEFKDLINVKNEAPELAFIKINATSTQKYTEGDVQNGVFPKIRSVANSFINVEIPDETNPYDSNYSSAGELLANGEPIDEVIEYTWSFDDDLLHENSNIAKASYSLGGYYDIKVRVDTEYGSYRITNYENSIDIIESSNLWLFNYKTLNDDSSGIVQSYEFGLNSETFKTIGNQTLLIERNNSFLNQPPLSYEEDKYYSETLKRATKEFQRNVDFAPIGTLNSGNKGNSLLFWAMGGSAADENKVQIKKYNAFDDIYTTIDPILNRPWNWLSLTSPESIHFLFGQPSSIVSRENKSYAKRLDFDLATQTQISSVDLNSSNFENGANELLDHPSLFDDDGVATNGYFATYRTAWKDSSGYILRNSSVNEFFRLSDFYKTKGTNSNLFSSITKMPDIIGSVKLEGQLVALYNGIFMFNNTGEICAWNDVSLTWEVGRANSSSLSFRSIQDTNVSGFDNKSNTLLATSDKDRIAYLSYDYSTKAFIKFNGTDLTFTLIKSRPVGAINPNLPSQFKLGVY